MLERKEGLTDFLELQSRVWFRFVELLFWCAGWDAFWAEIYYSIFYRLCDGC